jgi:hypothetical protein
MKKLIVFTMMALATIVMFSPTAFAGGDGGEKLVGTYEMVASGICNHSTLGWWDADHKKNGPKPPWRPIKGSQTWAANATMQGTVTFSADTVPPGTISPYTNYISLLPGGDPVVEIARYQVSESPMGAKFNYVLTGNVITITTLGGTVMHGGISSDRKTMTLVNASQILDLRETEYKSFAIQNMIRVLVRVSD